MNSTTLLEYLEQNAADNNENIKINIDTLAEELEISVPALIAILTELEQRDEIILEIITTNIPETTEVEYSGTVQLMKTPPDELLEGNAVVPD